MNQHQLKELVLESLIHEKGDIKVYEADINSIVQLMKTCKISGKGILRPLD